MIAILPEYKMSAEQLTETLAILDAAEAIDVTEDENSHFGEPALMV
jgi:hypothetical protein